VKASPTAVSYPGW